MVTGWNSRPCATQEPSLNLDIFSSFHLQQADTRASCAPMSFFSPSHEHGPIIESVDYFFLYTYLKCYHRFQACCPSHKTTAKTGTKTNHDITSGEKSRVAVRAASERGTQEIVGADHLGTTSFRAAAAAASTSVFGCDWLSESTEIRDSGFTSTRTSARPDPGGPVTGPSTEPGSCGPSRKCPV